MSAPRFYGASGAVELGSVEVWDPRAGESLERRWKGTPAAIDTIEGQLRAAGIPFRREVSPSGGYNIITGIYGAAETQAATEPLADLWDLLGNDMEKSIWLADEVRNELKKLGSALDPTQIAGLARLRADVEALARGDVITYNSTTGEEGTLTVAQWLNTITHLIEPVWPGNPAALNPAVFMRLLRSLSMGGEAFIISQYVLRHRLIIAKNSTIRPSTNNINRVYTNTLDMTTAESVPTDLPFDLPDGMWMKKTPTREQVAADKWQITQEWYHVDDYDDLAYQAAST
ncbi:MAG: hypothetical protein AB9869_01280 [Verrucomicrobiia bacterium]